MAESPNPTPSFIRRGGVIGSPVQLTNQICTRSSPGNVPLVLYDNSTDIDYVSGNGALCENLVIVPTGTIIKSVLFVFWKIVLDSASPWLLWDEIDLPALASSPADAKHSGYPLKAPLTRRILSPQPKVGSEQFPSAFRINGDSRAIQIGVALGTAVANSIIVWADGGEY